MRRKLLTSLVSICIIAVGLLAMNIGLGYRPALGLDLRGGISVTLLPAGQSGKDWTQASLDLAVERIRERVDSYGVGEPEILRQDNAIVVNLPGVNDQKKALELVTVTGKVYLRPVLQCVADTSAATTSSSTSTSTVGTATTVQGPASTTVTGIMLPSSPKTWVMPLFRPISPSFIAMAAFSSGKHQARTMDASRTNRLTGVLHRSVP